MKRGYNFTFLPPLCFYQLRISNVSNLIDDPVFEKLLCNLCGHSVLLSLSFYLDMKTERG